MNKKLTWLVILAVVAVAVIAVRFGQKPSEQRTVKVGGLFGITGYASFAGEASRDGFLMAIEDSGMKIDTPVEDFQSNNVRLVTAASKLVDVDRVKVVIGPEWNEFSEVIIPIANSKKTLFISPWMTGEQDWRNSPYYFSATPSERNQIRAILQHMAKHERKSIVLVYSNNTWSLGSVKVVHDELEKLKELQVVGEFVINQDAADYRTEVVKIKTLNPGAVYTIIATDAGQGIFNKQMRELGASYPIYAPASRAESSVLQSRFGEYSVGMIYSREKEYANMEKFAEKFEKKFGRKPGALSAATTYDVTTLVLRAIKNGAKTTAQIKAYLLSVKDYDGYSNKISFGPGGQIVPLEVEMRRLTKNGFEAVE